MMKHALGLSLSALIFLAMACGSEVKLIDVEPPSMSFTNLEQTARIKATAQDISGKNIPDVPISFRSENTSVAEVGADGTVKPRGDGRTVVASMAPNGVRGETTVRVCLPKEIVCDPPVLELRVGTANPLACHLVDCKDEKLTIAVTMTADENMLYKDEQGTTPSFVGKVVGETTIVVAGGGHEKSIKVKIDEQLFSPGMGPGSGGGRGGGGGGGKKGGDPYQKDGGRYNHILDNMKF
ncbi:MAG: hypothetical protein M0R76_00685 [Proteobacteria bacterium]|nr:hypothetical protein [Pseudomonadota bacterium]